MFKTRSKIFSTKKSSEEISKNNNLYSKTKIHNSLNFDSFLEDQLQASEMEILDKTQLRLEHHLADASLKKNQRMIISDKLDKSTLTLERALECQNQIDMLNIFGAFQEVSNLAVEDVEEQEITIGEREESPEELVNQRLLADQIMLLTKQFLANLRSQEIGDEVANSLDGELKRKVVHTFGFLRRNHLVCIFDELEIEEVPPNVLSKEEYLLVDCDVIRRKNGPKRIYLLKPSETADSFIIKKKKLGKSPLLRKVTRVTVEMEIKVRGSIKFTGAGGNDRELAPTHTLRQVDSTLRVPLVFENLEMQHKYRPLMKLFFEGHMDTSNALVYKNFEHFTIVDFNDSLNGNFFFK